MDYLMRDGLPTNASLLAAPEVWMEGAALQQLAAVARMPGCVAAVGMPDLHPGRGIPIGAVAAFGGVVHPRLVGSDAGCGARLTLSRVRVSSLDKLERRLRASMEEPPWSDGAALRMLKAAWVRGVAGLSDLDELPDDLRRMASEVAPEAAADCSLPGAFGVYATSLGSIGGGNHFLEVTRVHRAHSEDAAAYRGQIGVLAHSGSRGMGHALAQRWGADALEGDAIAVYLGELQGAVRFARLNRFLLSYRALKALGATREAKRTLSVDVTHNTVTRESACGHDCWVHRKGAAPAHAGEYTLVLGSREAHSYLMLGRGAGGALSSVAHGAGRRMTRSEAVGKLRPRYMRKELQRTSHGSRVICGDSALLYEEHPDAYKAIDPVVRTLEGSGAADTLLALRPLITLKI